MPRVTRAPTLISIAFTLSFIEPAQALTVSFVWRGGVSAAPISGLGTNQVVVSNADPATLTLDIEIGVGAAEVLSAASVDLEFDTDGGNELDIQSWSEFSWADQVDVVALE